MIEDQQHPKRCGHAVGKSVVCREEAMSRIQAAVDARHEYGLDILVIARTDARQTHGFTEAVQRCQQFCAIGADITFLEAPETLQEMREYCQQVPGYKMANMLARGKTPSCTPSQLQVYQALVSYKSPGPKCPKSTAIGVCIQGNEPIHPLRKSHPPFWGIVANSQKHREAKQPQGNDKKLSKN